MFIVDGKREIFINEKNIRKLKAQIRNVSSKKDLNIILLPLSSVSLNYYYYDDDFIYDDGFIGIDDDGKSIEYHINKGDFISIKPSYNEKEVERNLKQSKSKGLKEQINASLILEEDNNVNYLTEQDYFDIADIVSKNQIKDYYELDDARDAIDCIAEKINEYLESKGYLFDDEDIKGVAESFVSTELSLYETYTRNKYYHYSKMDIANTLRNEFKKIYMSNKKYYVEGSKIIYPSILDKVIELNALLGRRDTFYDREIMYLYKEIDKYFDALLDNSNEDLIYFNEKDLKTLRSLFYSENDCDVELSKPVQKKKRKK